VSSILVAACAAATATLVAAEYAGNFPVKAVMKTLAASCFVALAITGGALAVGPAGLAVTVGLGLSMVGDLCLLSRERRWFLAGLVAFLLAHVAYAVGFVALGVHVIAVAVAAVPLAALAMVVWRWLAPQVGALGRPVQAYIAVISWMVALALGAAVADPTPARIGLLVSAIVFFLSDLCVARDRFVAPGPANRAVGLPLYFGSQVGFALSIVGV
jgi:uncharacterized membrane protein YhhN